jgi:Tfp pilus assembly protein PilO
MGQKRILYYAFFLTLVIMAGLGYFISYPMTQGINSSKEELGKKQSELRFLEQKEIRLKELSKDYEKYQDEIETISKLFPDEKEVSDYLTQLEKASGRNNVSLTSIKVKESSTKNKNEKVLPDRTQMTKVGNLYKLTMSISFTTDNYQNLINFMKTLENLSRYTEISISRITSVENQLDITMELNIYVR